jgi:hypothetical protein
MLEKNLYVIEKCKEELLKAPITRWVEIIEKTASTTHLSDKSSV